MMMGSADAIPVAPEKAPVFVEDLPEEDQDGALQVGHLCTDPFLPMSTTHLLLNIQPV